MNYIACVKGAFYFPYVLTIPVGSIPPLLLTILLNFYVLNIIKIHLEMIAKVPDVEGLTKVCWDRSLDSNWTVEVICPKD